MKELKIESQIKFKLVDALNYMNETYCFNSKFIFEKLEPTCRLWMKKTNGTIKEWYSLIEKVIRELISEKVLIVQEYDLFSLGDIYESSYADYVWELYEVFICEFDEADVILSEKDIDYINDLFEKHCNRDGATINGCEVELFRMDFIHNRCKSDF